MMTRYPLLVVLALLVACGDNQKPNLPPTIADVDVTTLENTPVVITVSAQDANGDTLEVTFAPPNHGTLAGTGPSVTYTPTANFSGEDAFKVTVSDGKATAMATVRVTVQEVNSAPVAGDDTATTDEDVALTLAASVLLANDTDADGDTLTLSRVQNPSGGAVVLSGTTLTFTPDANFNGTASFEYVVTDGSANSIGRVTVTVDPINDAPVATPVTVSTPQSTSVTITLVATDVDGDALTFTTTTPAHGTLSGTGATRVYRPTPGFLGQDTFTFEASDGSLTSNTATVTLTVTPPPVCGDGTTDPGEVCDDGNRTAGDGCRADCRGVEVCGDGLVDSTVGEQCDDGNTASGDGCDATCKLDTFSTVPAQLISGTLNCTTQVSNSGRKVAVDALGRFFAVMRCNNTVHVSVSVDRGQTWVGPTSLGISNASEVAIEGGPTGVAYVVAAASPGKLLFTRTLDAGATWEGPRELTSVATATLGLDSLGDAIYISAKVNGTTLRVLRNFSRGEDAFESTDVTQNSAFHDLVVDKISADVFSVSDSPAFRIRRSSDMGISFGPESTPPGQAFYSDWTGSNGFLYAVGTNGDDNVDVIPVSAPGTSTQVTGLPTDVGATSNRAIDADALGNAYVVTGRNTGDVQLDRMRVGATSISAADARSIGAGTFPAVAALPSNSGAFVAYTNGTSVYGAVVAY
ncbi:tandem-95 repeat protein [Archangium primigenium]|uniref:tandem-95 repeat protein n=1 Tax=[Archangium] primigenium TaxID=2792470 RepID=UPI00195AA5B9|nr:Ig-like domain-containing protein [Archangium primigenium]MBM7113514.1 tandem-95 repeat protein [Archangium primigenium]